MPEDMQLFLQKTWRRIAAETGADFLILIFGLIASLVAAHTLLVGR